MENQINVDVIKAKLYDFFCNEAGVVIYKSDRDDEYSRELNKLLNIGRVVLSEYPDMNAEIAEEPSSQDFLFNLDKINEDDCVVNRIVMSTGAIIKIAIFPKAGYEWNTEERELVRGFLLIMTTVKSTSQRM